MKLNNPLLVKFCWSWIILISLVTIAHSIYRSWLIAEWISGNDVQNLLNPNQPNDPGYAEHWLIAYLHLIPGIIIYLLGPLQFLESVRKKARNIHRWSGYIFISCIMISGSASILIGITFPVGGSSATVSTIMFATIMMFSVSRALYLAYQKKMSLHREWMIRGYMMALAPGTIQFIVPFFLFIGGKEIAEALPLSVSIGFTLHLILAEIWIHNSYPARKTRLA